MARKKLIAVAIGLLMPAAAQALTLGYIKVGSLLDQPLKAAIEVTADQPAELESLRVGLASPGEFSKKGIPRLSLLDDLSFQVVRRGANKALIVVTSRSPVREPIVDFLVDASWADGQVTREYTLLLDPPLTADRNPPAIDIPATAAPVRVPASEPVRIPPSKPTVTKKPPKSAPAAAAKPKPAPKALSAGDEVTVRAGATLWRIASPITPDGATVYQTMNALYQNNPSAFGGNINNLYKGSVLRVPAKEEILALDPEASQRLLAEHTRAWQTGTPVSTEIAEAATQSVPEEVASPDAATAAEDAESATLRLASAGEGVSPVSDSDSDVAAPETAPAATTESQSADSELVLAREKAASAEQEVDNLRERLVDLEERLMDAQRLLELKDEQLARLQDYYAREAGEAPPADVPATEPDVMPATIAADEPASEPSAAEAYAELPPWRQSLTGPVELSAVKAMETAPAEAAMDASAEDAPSASSPAMAESQSGGTTPPWRQGLTGEVPQAGPVTSEVTMEPAQPPSMEATEPVVAEEAPAPAAPETTEPTAVAPEPAPEPAEQPAAPIEPPTETAAAPEPKSKTSPPAEASPFLPDELAGLPLLPTLGFLAVAGLIGLFLVGRRRDGDDDETSASGKEAALAAASLQREKAELEADLAILDERIAAHEWDDAAKRVEALIAVNPEDPGLNLRNLEILYGSGDKDGFMSHANKLANTGFAADHPVFWGQVESMGQKLVPGATLFSPQAGGQPGGAVSDRDLDGMLDTLESQLDVGDDRLRDEAASRLGETASDLETVSVLGGEDGLDFDPDAAIAPDADKQEEILRDPQEGLDFETTTGLGDTAPPATEPPTLEDTLEFDLGELGEHLDAGSAAGEEDKVVPIKTDEGITAPTMPPVTEQDVETKLDLARAFLDLGDMEGARSILEEVVSEGNDRQRGEAESLLENTG